MRSGACSWAIRRPLLFKYALASAKSIASRTDFSRTLCGKEGGGWATLSLHTEIPLPHAERGLDKLAARHLIADFIFLDPPYADDGCIEVLEYLDASHLLAPQGIVIAEHSSKLELPERLVRLERTRLLEQGDAALSFYRLAAAA
jgi:16S rRNA G966 N2-methylase RsmD